MFLAEVTNSKHNRNGEVIMIFFIIAQLKAKNIDSHGVIKTDRFVIY